MLLRQGLEELGLLLGVHAPERRVALREAAELLDGLEVAVRCERVSLCMQIAPQQRRRELGQVLVARPVESPLAP